MPSEPATGAAVASGLRPDGPHRYEPEGNFLTDLPARNDDGTINVVVEIPAGTNEKWEVTADGSALIREFTGDEPRMIDYLPYPGCYGMVPRTLMAEAQGGDGASLDVLVLGPAVPRGSVIRARPIGVIRTIDRGRRDDKLLAVTAGSTFSGVRDLRTLDSRYPGAKDILQEWFSHAFGKRSKVKIIGAESIGPALHLVDFASRSYEKAHPPGSD